MMSHSIEPLGYIRSPYKEKFAVPRQPGLVNAARTELTLIAPYNAREIIDGIDQFSHLWLIFGFHQNTQAGWQNKIRPPRLGGNQRIGVLASRSTFRPNGLGLSVLKLNAVEYSRQGPTLIFEGGDLVDGTPVYDIKPYLSYADAIEQAHSGYAQEAPEAPLQVTFSQQANHQLAQLNVTEQEQQLMLQVLAQDPRPVYRRDKPDAHSYGVKLARFNLCFCVEGQQCLITELTLL